MAFNRPTLTEIAERIESDIRTGLKVGPGLRRSGIKVISRAFAGAVHLLYGYLSYLAKQIFPDTAEGWFLDRWASIWGVTRKPADFSIGNVTFSGTDEKTIAAGSIVQREDGVQYLVDAVLTVSGGTVTGSVTAVEAGLSGDSAADTALTITQTINGVQAASVVAPGGISGGADRESDDSLRSRLLDRIQNPPQGGCAHDYVQWALEVSGVTRAWPYSNHTGPGTVGVSFVLDDNTNSIIPNEQKVAEVQAHIDGLSPVTADVTVFAPVAAPLALTIKIYPNTAEVRAAVGAEIVDLIRRRSASGGADNVTGKILLSEINEAISIAKGELDHVLVSPVEDVVPTRGHIVTGGVITWQDL